MRVNTLTLAQRLGSPPDRVFPFFADARNLERITPPWLRFRVLTPDPIEMSAGTRIDYRLELHHVPLRWRSEIVLWDPPRRFVDVQISGPYSLWHHTHTFESEDRGTLMRDLVRYGLPLGPLGALANALLVRHDLEQIFAFRQREVAAILNEHALRARPAAASFTK